MVSNANNSEFDSENAVASFSRWSGASSQFTNLLGAAKRQRWVLVASIAAGLIVGAVFLVQAIPKYTSSATVLIDAKNVSMADASPLEQSLTFDTGAIDSQVQILLSDYLAASVVTGLGLQNNMAFIDPPRSLFDRVTHSLVAGVSDKVAQLRGREPPKSVAELPESVRILLAQNKLENNIKVTRVGRTFVLGIDYTDVDPNMAMAIAGQYANAYLEDQLNSKFDASRRASVWMDDRIRDLKAKALAADQAVQKYREANKLTEASGRLISEQTLTDATTQLSLAQGELNTAKAKFDRLKQIIDSHDYTGSLAETLGSTVISQLRVKYLESAKLNADVSARYGANHRAAVNARADMQQFEGLIFQELTRLLQSYQSDVAIASDKVSNYQHSIESMRQTNASDNEALVKLKSLEQEASTYNALYTAFLQKFQETQQQQSFPVTDARIISPPSTPAGPSSPKTVLVIAVSMLLGGLVGGAIGAVREFKERGFRTGSQVREDLGLDFICNVPTIQRSAFKERRQRQSSSATSHLVRSTHLALDYAVSEPLSRFSEALRAIKISIDHAFLDRKGIVVGLVSMYPGEGKSTVAKNLASLAAAQGQKVVLIDGDLRNPKLTRDLAGEAREGLLDVLSKGHPYSASLYYEEDTGLAFLPGATHRRFSSPSESLGSNRMRALIEDLKSEYDLIIVDLPPAGVVTDAMAVYPFVDGYVFAVEWGTTPRHVVRDLLIDEQEMADKIIGVVITKVNLKKLNFYSSYAAYGYDGHKASHYYEEGA